MTSFSVEVTFDSLFFWYLYGKDSGKINDEQKHFCEKLQRAIRFKDSNFSLTGKSAKIAPSSISVDSTVEIGKQPQKIVLR
jgi:hypothetical protein